MAVISIENGDNFGADGSLLNDQFPDSYRQLESAGAGATGIEVECAVSGFLLRDVTVAGDHDFEASHFGFQIELSQVVEDIDADAPKFHEFGLRKFARPRFFVDVAANGGHGRDLFQSVENLWIADVSGVNDVVRAMKCLQSLGTKQTVRVGNDADVNGVLTSQCVEFAWAACGSSASTGSFLRVRAPHPCWNRCRQFLLLPLTGATGPASFASGPTPG